MSAATHPVIGASRPARLDLARLKQASPLLGVLCLIAIAVTLFPLVMCFSASIKTAQEASAVPPHYWPSAFSVENYEKVFHYQAGLPAYLGNSLAVAALTIALCLGLGAPAAFGLARFPMPAKELIFIILLSSLMIPYQALLTPLARPCQYVPRPRHRPYGHPAPFLHLPPAQFFRRDAAGIGGSGDHRRL
jgi:ABC-type glycerol-3-phosphate transport system permease component